MLQFVCDSCSVVKDPDDVWILGLAAEAVGVTAARREVNLLSGWDRDSAVHPLAVHFCSVECKDRYMQALFGRDSGDELVEEDTVLTEEVDPDDYVETTTTTRPARSRGLRTATVRSKSAPTKSAPSKKAAGRETAKTGKKRASGSSRRKGTR